MSYADLAAFKAYLRIDDSVDDVELQRALDAATSEITHLCSRDFTPPDPMDPLTDRYFQPYYDTRNGAWVLPVDDIGDLTGLTMSTWDETDLNWTVTVDPATLAWRPIGTPGVGTVSTSAILPAGAYTGPRGFTGWASNDNASYVKVMARFGWATIPEAIVEATLIQASRVFKRRDAPFGLVGAPDGSDNTRLLNKVDADVEVLIRGYVKYWAAR